MARELVDDKYLQYQFPNSLITVYKGRTTEGVIEYTMIVRNKETNKVTHRADVKCHLDDVLTPRVLRNALLNNVVTY